MPWRSAALGLILLIAACGDSGTEPLQQTTDVIRKLNLPSMGEIKALPASTVAQIERVTSANAPNLKQAWGDFLKGDKLDDAIARAGLSKDSEGVRVVFGTAKQLSAEIEETKDDVRADRNGAKVSREDAGKVTCFALDFYVRRGSFPTSEQLERFGIETRLKQAPLIGSQVERAKTFVDITARIKNNSPNRIAMRGALSLICGPQPLIV
jgi:hypothetical protein